MKPKIAIYVEGGWMNQKIAVRIRRGIITGILSNVNNDIFVEIIDEDVIGWESCEHRWKELQTELEFGG